MREILFRGKRLDNGEWVEARTIISTNDADPICWMLVRGEKFLAEEDAHGNILSVEPQTAIYRVDPATVGQYTGLTDKHGKRIFEGDIVRTQPFSDRPYSKRAKFKQHIGVVAYTAHHFENSQYEQTYEAVWRVKIKNYDGFGCCNWSAFFKCEVIGNIHDNPGLLEGADNG